MNLKQTDIYHLQIDMTLKHRIPQVCVCVGGGGGQTDIYYLQIDMTLKHRIPQVCVCVWGGGGGGGRFQKSGYILFPEYDLDISPNAITSSFGRTLSTTKV